MFCDRSTYLAVLEVKLESTKKKEDPGFKTGYPVYFYLGCKGTANHKVVYNFAPFTKIACNSTPVFLAGEVRRSGSRLYF